jgi:NADH:ubiquinone reductase (H+-translocating)
MPAATTPVPQVVIVGAGLGGLAAERALRRVPVSVTVVDAHNYATFAPLLFEAAVGVIVPEDVARPIRSFLGRRGHTTFRLDEVVAIDWARKRVELADGDELPFDYLILAPGVVPWYGAMPGAAEHAVPLKTVPDAAHIRNSILRSFEAAAAHPDRAGPEATTVAIIGGGASGVELGGYLSDVLWRSFVSDYPEIPREQMRLIVLELGDRLLPGFDRRLSRYAEAALRRRGVEVRLRTRVDRIDAGAIVLDGGERIRASTTVWAGGVSAPVWLTDAGMASEQRRVVVDADLRLADHPNAFVIGDAAAVRSRSGPLQPQVAQVAVQGGRHAAHQIERLLAGRPTRPFRYFDKGTMAMVGVYAAVVQSGRLRLTGRLAWVAWGLLHVAYLPGMANRLRALQTWRWWHVTHEASARVLIDDRSEPEPARAERERLRRQTTGVSDD